MGPRPQRVMLVQLVRALRHARRVELAAHGRTHRARAIAACRSLMRPTVDTGWQADEIASAVGMAGGTDRKRVAADRPDADASGAGSTSPPHHRRVRTRSA